MKIGIIGTRGIPNHYGGFEQFLEFFAPFLVEHGVETYVYNSSLHPYKNEEYKGVKLIHCYDPEDKIGTAGQFIYDLNCILDARKRNFDIILQLGYTSSGIWNFLLPKESLVFTNIDGKEWLRSKYNSWTKKFLKLSENWAVQRSDHIICDSKGIKVYLKNEYGLKGSFIPYGAEVPSDFKEETLEEYDIKPYQYSVLIARMEPENNIEMILEAYENSNLKEPLLVIGNHENTKHGKKWFQQYRDSQKIRFLGGIYDQDKLNDIRHFSRYYFHGHSVGGTNPSLLEAMASNARILAHNNEFNQSVLEKYGLYFTSSQELENMLNQKVQVLFEGEQEHIQKLYSYDSIHQQYLNLFRQWKEK